MIELLKLSFLNNLATLVAPVLSEALWSRFRNSNFEFRGTDGRGYLPFYHNCLALVAPVMQQRGYIDDLA